MSTVRETPATPVEIYPKGLATNHGSGHLCVLMEDYKICNHPLRFARRHLLISDIKSDIMPLNKQLGVTYR